MKRRDFVALNKLGLKETQAIVFYVSRYGMVISPEHEDALDSLGKVVRSLDEQL